jgi:hypothetical protein
LVSVALQGDLRLRLQYVTDRAKNLRRRAGGALQVVILVVLAELAVRPRRVPLRE